jgi:hypothetical protein
MTDRLPAPPPRAPSRPAIDVTPAPRRWAAWLRRTAAPAFRAFCRAAARRRARGGARPARVARRGLPGSGGRLVPVAAAAGADVFVTGEVRYHNMREAEHHGLAIVELGHDRTEMPAVDLLARLIRGGLAAVGASVPVATYKEPRAARTAAGR